jgi:fructokinase
LLDLGGDDPWKFAAALRDRYDVALTCITRAEAGCLLITAEETADVAGHAVTVVDAVGAGDAFTAALIAARLWDWPLSESARFANATGALVATRSGAMPALTAELTDLRDQYAS